MPRRFVASHIKCFELAEYFLRDVPGYTIEHSKELADQVHQVCNNYCANLEKKHGELGSA